MSAAVVGDRGPVEQKEKSKLPGVLTQAHIQAVKITIQDNNEFPEKRHEAAHPSRGMHGNEHGIHPLVKRVPGNGLSPGKGTIVRQRAVDGAALTRENHDAWQKIHFPPLPPPSS